MHWVLGHERRAAEAMCRVKGRRTAQRHSGTACVHVLADGWGAALPASQPQRPMVRCILVYMHCSVYALVQNTTHAAQEALAQEAVAQAVGMEWKSTTQAVVWQLVGEYFIYCYICPAKKPV
jgi:hypothetical protein